MPDFAGGEQRFELATELIELWFNRWKLIAPDVNSVLLPSDLQNLVHKIRINLELVERVLEQFDLHIQIHAWRPV